MANVILESAEWGEVHLDELDITALAEVSGLEPQECIRRLSDNRLADMAAQWHEAAPRSPEHIRSFYGQTFLYLWELLGWNHSEAYRPYWEDVARLIELFPPSSHPRVLDYGSGVGSTALHMARAGYHVTLVDIDGPTFQFAQRRLVAHGCGFDTLEVTADVPDLPAASWDVLICFDVLEHVFEPEAVTRALVGALRVGGGAAIVAAFDANEATHPHHLADRSLALREHRFDLFLQGAGMVPQGKSVYRLAPWPERMLRIARYRLWHTTGVIITRMPR